MGRQSILEKKMTSGRVFRYLLERPEADKKLVIARRYLDKLFKSKKSNRKKEYKQQLDNILKFLVCDSTDLTEYKEKLKKLKKDFAHESEKRSHLQDRVLTLERKLRNLKQATQPIS